MNAFVHEIKPEIHHVYTPLTHEQIITAYKNGYTVTGVVENVLGDEKIVQVRLGDDILAKLPFSEVTIYPLRYSKKVQSDLPTNIRCLMQKKIRVKITKVKDDEIILSRKLNMIEAYFKLLFEKTVMMYITEVIEKSVFGDIGEGLCGKMLINEICRTHIHHAKHRMKIGQTVEVLLTGVDQERRFAVSYRQTFKPFCKEDYPVGMMLTGTVGDWIKVGNTSTYYVEITPQVPAILTIYKRCHLKYGTKVECVVKGANDKGLFVELNENTELEK